jgi:hypothetical protein
LTSQTSVDDVRAQYPDDNDPYVRAFLYAEFPTGTTAKTLPMTFLSKTLPVKQSGNPDFVDLEWKAKAARTGPIRLGVDVASDGGDELVVAKRDGWHGSIVHHSSGPVNENAEVVAGVVKKFILESCAQHDEREIREPVMVNVDRTGVGWGVTSILQNWVVKQRLNCVVVGVMVGDRAKQNTRFTKQRSEIWWNFRELLQGDDVDITLEESGEANRSLIKQLNGPTYSTGTDGRIQVEKKSDMAKRGASSPDRADAILLAYYESPSKRRNTVPRMFPELRQENVHHVQRYDD